MRRHEAWAEGMLPVSPAWLNVIECQHQSPSSFALLVDPAEDPWAGRKPWSVTVTGGDKTRFLTARCAIA